MPQRRHVIASLGACLAIAILAGSAFAQTALDPVTLTSVSTGHGKARLTVTAGPSGAPNGFKVRWMTTEQFAALGGAWPGMVSPGEGWVNYTGTGTLDTWGATDVSFQLAPNQSIDIEIGDTFDETGVSGTSYQELQDASTYVVTATALGGGAVTNSPLSGHQDCGTSQQGHDCVYTQGYWKNHTSAWPVGSLTLGTTTYSAAQLLSILNTSVKGNGLLSLAHQLIATKLNIAYGANASSIASTVNAADALIAGRIVPPVGSGSLSTSSTSALTQALDDFNNDNDHHNHCGTVPVQPSTWGQLKVIYR